MIRDAPVRDTRHNRDEPMLRQPIARAPLTLCGPNEPISKIEKSKFRRKEYTFRQSHFRKFKIDAIS